MQIFFPLTPKFFPSAPNQPDPTFTAGTGAGTFLIDTINRIVSILFTTYTYWGRNSKQNHPIHHNHHPHIHNHNDRKKHNHNLAPSAPHNYKSQPQVTTTNHNRKSQPLSSNKVLLTSQNPTSASSSANPTTGARSCLQLHSFIKKITSEWQINAK